MKIEAAFRFGAECQGKFERVEFFKLTIQLQPAGTIETPIDNWDRAAPKVLRRFLGLRKRLVFARSLIEF